MYDLIIRRGLNKKKVTVCIILLILLVTLATISGIRFAEHHEVKKQAKLYSFNVASGDAYTVEYLCE